MLPKYTSFVKKPKVGLLLIVFILVLLNYFGIGQDQNMHKVLEVSDGDTIVVDLYGKTETIRFIGVDTPETHHPSKPVQCYGPEASNYTKYLLEGEYVRLEVDPLSDNRDRYDRLLRFIYTKNGVLVNYSLVEQGFGFAITSFAHSKMPSFVLAQAEADKQNKGLWGSCNIDNSGNYPSTTSRGASS